MYSETEVDASVHAPRWAAGTEPSSRQEGCAQPPELSYVRHGRACHLISGRESLYFGNNLDIVECIIRVEPICAATDKTGRVCSMKLRELERNLQSVSGFEAPKAELEQYVTTPHLAAQLVHTMHSDFDEVEDKIVCDLGCGSGMLTLAAVMAGAQHVTGIDVDSDALALAKANVAESGCEELVDLVQADLATDVFKASKIFDTVVMNPPFGTKRKGVDILFLQTGLNLAREAVYSMHKTTTRGFIEKKFRGFGVEATVCFANGASMQSD